MYRYTFTKFNMMFIGLDINKCKIFFILYVLLFLIFFIYTPQTTTAQSSSSGVVATTTLIISICGNGIVDPGEECDNPDDTGAYSTTIAGRQCTPQCTWAPYCGDGILQTQFGEQCDDGNNEDGDFCSADCKLIIPPGTGGAGSSGGGGSAGGSFEEMGPTRISVSGLSYPNQTVNILLDNSPVGSVTANSAGRFSFTTEAEPGVASMGFWATDSFGTRSVTFNTTFDVTQGAITNLNSIMLPPTLRIDNPEANPGDVINISGQALPNVTVEVQVGEGRAVERVTADDSGSWSLSYNTAGLAPSAYSVRARYSLNTGTALATESGYSRTVQLFLGVDGATISPADLNRDGRVNLIDFSILVFWWGTDGGNSDPPADINGDGTVGLADFSILLFNWTG